MDEAIQEKKKINLKILILIIGIISIAAVFITLVLPVISPTQNAQPVVLTVSTLEKIVDQSELSTFTAVYNGVARVNNEKDPEKIDFFVSYEATVTAGIDFKQIDIDINDEKQTIEISLPKPRINDINVDINSLDYIFYNKKADTPKAQGVAYRVCEEDVKEESSRQEAILELAAQNAQNIIKALTEPIVSQFYPDYSLTVK